MNMRLASVTLKLHRFEVAVSVVAAIATGIGALAILIQLDRVAIPSECLAWLASGWTDAPSGCRSGLQQYVDIIVLQGQELFRVMGFLPFAVGLLVSVPIVARELEAGTAHTAWSLDGSRVRWLRRQIWPIAATVGLAVALAAATTDLVAREDQAVGGSAMTLLGLHGIPVMARLVAAFGLGLLAGSIIARTLPALVIGGVLCVAVFVGVSETKEAWIKAQESSPRLDGETRIWAFNGEWQWLSPDGRLLSHEEVSAIVPDELERADVGLIQPFHSMEWLEERGYEIVPMGIPETQAVSGWYAYDLLLYSSAGIMATSAAFVVVNRRRP